MVPIGTAVSLSLQGEDATWMDLEDTMASERRHSRKHKPCIAPLSPTEGQRATWRGWGRGELRIVTWSVLFPLL